MSLLDYTCTYVFCVCSSTFNVIFIAERLVSASEARLMIVSHRRIHKRCTINLTFCPCACISVYVPNAMGWVGVTLMVSTMDDNITELSEYFVVVINSTDQQSVVEIGTPNTTVITIEDNDPGINFMCTV